MVTTKYRYKQQGVVVVSFINYSDIYDQLLILAQDQFRKIDDQIIYIVQDWLKNNENI